MIDPDDARVIHKAAIKERAALCAGPVAKRIKTEETQAYAVVGELVVTMTRLDSQLNHVLVAVLELKNTQSLVSFVESVVATLDSTRKIEILKECARLMKNGAPPIIGKDISKYCEKIELVRRKRDIACHTPPSPQVDRWIPVALAKSLKTSAKAHLGVTTLDDFRKAIQTGGEALELGSEIIELFLRSPLLNDPEVHRPRRTAADNGDGEPT
jgi:hypothetical protein